MEIVIDFIFLGMKITVDSDFRHEMKKDACSLDQKTVVILFLDGRM